MVDGQQAHGQKQVVIPNLGDSGRLPPSGFHASAQLCQTVYVQCVLPLSAFMVSVPSLRFPATFQHAQLFVAPA